MDIAGFTQKVVSLEAELQDISSQESKDEASLAKVKKQLRDLEAKVKDQEEELDEQAGSIQMLEQVPEVGQGREEAQQEVSPPSPLTQALEGQGLHSFIYSSCQSFSQSLVHLFIQCVNTWSVPATGRRRLSLRRAFHKIRSWLVPERKEREDNAARGPGAHRAGD